MGRLIGGCLGGAYAAAQGAAIKWALSSSDVFEPLMVNIFVAHLFWVAWYIARRHLLEKKKSSGHEASRQAV